MKCSFVFVMAVAVVLHQHAMPLAAANEMKCTVVAGSANAMFIHPSAMCGRTVTFGMHPQIGAGVRIGNGTKCGNNIKLEANVKLGNNNCVADNTLIEHDDILFPTDDNDDTYSEEIYDHASWQMAETSLLMLEASDGYKFVYSDGKCVTEKIIGDPDVIVPCRNLVPTADRSARCASDAKFGATEIANDVKIDKQCRFGDNFKIAEGAHLGPGTTAGRNVHIGKFVCSEGELHIPDNKTVPEWHHVYLDTISQQLKYRKPRTGFKYVLENLRCVLEARVAPVMLPDNGHLVNCLDLTKHSLIMANVKCGADVIFANEPALYDGVAIGHFCEFGLDLFVDQGAEIGNFVSSGEDVDIGRHACVESRVYLPSGTKVLDFHAVVINDERDDISVRQPSDEEMYILNGSGKCVLTKRVVHRSQGIVQAKNSIVAHMVVPDETEYELCKPDEEMRSTIGAGAVIKCKTQFKSDGKTRTIQGRAKIAGIIYMDRHASADRGLTVAQGSIVTVGPGTTLSYDCKFEGRVIIGARNRIGMHSKLINARIDDDTFIAIAATIDGGHVKAKGVVMSNAKMEPRTEVGAGASLGERSTLYEGYKIGAGSCVEAEVEVRFDVLPGKIVTINGISRNIGAGKKAVPGYNGDCREVDENNPLY